MYQDSSNTYSERENELNFTSYQRNTDNFFTLSCQIWMHHLYHSEFLKLEKKKDHYLSLSLVTVFQRIVPNLVMDSKGHKNVYII